MKILSTLLVLCMLLAGCDAPEQNSVSVEHAQQEQGVKSLIDNQPVPNLGGWSFERHVVIQTYLARNKTIATWTYQETLDGKFIEICASIGYPIPYSTQLTNPQQVIVDRGQYGGGNVTVAQSEPNGLYPPGDASATIVSCVNKDGSVTPTYWEPSVIAFPYRIKSDKAVERYDDKAPTFSVDPNGK